MSQLGIGRIEFDPKPDCMGEGRVKITRLGAFRPHSYYSLPSDVIQQLMDPKRVIVYVSGGVVQNVDVPAGVIVEVRDYDIEQEDWDHAVQSGDRDVGSDEKGDIFERGVWRGE